MLSTHPVAPPYFLSTQALAGVLITYVVHWSIRGGIRRICIVVQNPETRRRIELGTFLIVTWGIHAGLTMIKYNTFLSRFRAVDPAFSATQMGLYAGAVYRIEEFLISSPPRLLGTAEEIANEAREVKWEPYITSIIKFILVYGLIIAVHNLFIPYTQIDEIMIPALAMAITFFPSSNRERREIAIQPVESAIVQQEELSIEENLDEESPSSRELVHN